MGCGLRDEGVPPNRRHLTGASGALSATANLHASNPTVNAERSPRLDPAHGGRAGGAGAVHRQRYDYPLEAAG
jgi:hypothetical protein